MTAQPPVGELVEYIRQRLTDHIALRMLGDELEADTLRDKLFNELAARPPLELAEMVVHARGSMPREAMKELLVGSFQTDPAEILAACSPAQLATALLRLLHQTARRTARRAIVQPTTDFVGDRSE